MGLERDFTAHVHRSLSYSRKRLEQLPIQVEVPKMDAKAKELAIYLVERVQKYNSQPVVYKFHDI
jgi:hypothetical protein